MLAAARSPILDRAATAQMSVAVCNRLADLPVGRVGDCLANVDGPGGNSDVDWLTSRDCSVGWPTLNQRSGCAVRLLVALGDCSADVASASRMCNPDVVRPMLNRRSGCRLATGLGVRVVDSGSRLQGSVGASRLAPARVFDLDRSEQHS